MKEFLYGALVGALVAAAVAYAIWQQPPGQVVTRNVYVDKREPPALRTPALPPFTRWIFSRRTDTIRVPVVVPIDFGRVHGVLRPDWIHVGRRAVDVQYWMPDSLRYIKERYVWPEPRWGVELTASAGYDAFVGAYAESELEVRRDKWFGYVGYIASATGSHSLSFGIKRRIFSF